LRTQASRYFFRRRLTACHDVPPWARARQASFEHVYEVHFHTSPSDDKNPRDLRERGLEDLEMVRRTLEREFVLQRQGERRYCRNLSLDRRAAGPCLRNERH
jgi:hypothetical protein